MAQRNVSKSELCDLFGESARQIEKYVQEGMPCEGTHRSRTFPWPEVRNWRDDRIRRLEREKVQRDEPLDFEKAKGRKMEAEAREAEIRVERMLGTVVPLDVVEEVVGRIADRLLPVLQNLPSNYGLRLEEAGVSAAAAEALLETIALELTTTLRDAVEEEDDAGDGEDATDVA